MESGVLQIDSQAVGIRVLAWRPSTDHPGLGLTIPGRRTKKSRPPEQGNRLLQSPVTTAGDWTA